jgi:hypothetical protein
LVVAPQTFGACRHEYVEMTSSSFQTDANGVRNPNVMESGFSGFSDVELSRLRRHQSSDAVETGSDRESITRRASAGGHVSASITQSTEAVLKKATPNFTNASQKREFDFL